MLTLYDAARCPYCARTRIVLAEKGVEHETVAIDLDDRPEWIVTKNPPHGRVPVLESDRWILPESAVIGEFLEERYPEPALLPREPAERAVARLLVFRFTDFEKPYYAFRRGEDGARGRFLEMLRWLDGVCAVSPYLTGRLFGLADIAYLPWVIRARDLLGVDLAPFPALEDWLAGVSERPSVQHELRTVASLPR